MGADKNAAAKDEIDEIMSEIETLQQEADTAVATKPKPALTVVPPAGIEAAAQVAVAGVEEFKGGADDAPMEETLGSMKGEEPAEGSLLSVADNPPDEEVTEEVQEVEATEEERQEEAGEEAEEEVEEAGTGNEEEEVAEKATAINGAAAEGCMTMKLAGSMTLKLKYEFEGQEVIIGFADRMLRVILSDGTEFKIPIRRATGESKAA
ncbi:MAG: hypothetical protein A2583_03940 [Bdellovibrionales bacterium RIFOXYD1_FULL_53_11]|nr:MAG: hypothetical protein A2583_03940 [Bdellovibrionales bacterium RIFOXYD1_FULL_53_11]